MISVSVGCLTKQFTCVFPESELENSVREVPNSDGSKFVTARPISTSHNSTAECSHPIIIPLPSQSQETHVGLDLSFPPCLKLARNGDRELIRVSQILTVVSAAAEAKRGC